LGLVEEAFRGVVTGFVFEFAVEIEGEASWAGVAGPDNSTAVDTIAIIPFSMMALIAPRWLLVAKQSTGTVAFSMGFGDDVDKALSICVSTPETTQGGYYDRALWFSTSLLCPRPFPT
jgi:hypothetical protein